jgi:hypothetical protein
MNLFGPFGASQAKKQFAKKNPQAVYAVGGLSVLPQLGFYRGGGGYRGMGRRLVGLMGLNLQRAMQLQRAIGH